MVRQPEVGRWDCFCAVAYCLRMIAPGLGHVSLDTTNLYAVPNRKAAGSMFRACRADSAVAIRTSRI
jgi:hypothetical protein